MTLLSQIHKKGHLFEEFDQIPVDIQTTDTFPFSKGKEAKPPDIAKINS